MSDPAPPVPRGRHAPPLEVRLERQKARLFAAAAAVFARVGYAEASAEAISREAGMSKATFYEHFANKEECILALFDAASAQVRDGGRRVDRDRRVARGRASTRASARSSRRSSRSPTTRGRCSSRSSAPGPRAVERRDACCRTFADYIDARERGRAPSASACRASKSPDDAYALVGAIVELASRQLRHGVPAEPLELEPVIERLIAGLLAATAS